MARPRKSPERDEDIAGDDKPVFDRGAGAAFVSGEINPSDIGGAEPAGSPGDIAEEAAPKKRRGRRSNAEIEAAGGEIPRKGRKKGDVSLDKGLLAGFLMMANNFAAGHFGAPQFFIDQNEGELLGGAVYDVLDHYGLAKWVGKYGVWANLAAAVGTVYGSKMGLALRAKGEALKSWQQDPPGPSDAQVALAQSLGFGA